MIALALSASACTTSFRQQDLMNLRPGTKKQEVNLVLGAPENVISMEQRGGSLLEIYEGLGLYNDYTVRPCMTSHESHRKAACGKTARVV